MFRLVQPLERLLAAGQHQPGFRGVDSLGEGGANVGLCFGPAAGVTQRSSKVVLGHPGFRICSQGFAIPANRLFEAASSLQLMRFAHERGRVFR